MDIKLASDVKNIQRQLQSLRRKLDNHSLESRRANRQYRRWCEEVVKNPPLEKKAAETDTSPRIEFHLRAIQSLLLTSSQEYYRDRGSAMYDWCLHIESQLRSLGKIKDEQIFPEKKKTPSLKNND